MYGGAAQSTNNAAGGQFEHQGPPVINYSQGNGIAVKETSENYQFYIFNPLKPSCFSLINVVINLFEIKKQLLFVIVVTAL
jgi:hypothetical protein